MNFDKLYGYVADEKVKRTAKVNLIKISKMNNKTLPQMSTTNVIAVQNKQYNRNTTNIRSILMSNRGSNSISDFQDDGI